MSAEYAIEGRALSKVYGLSGRSAVTALAHSDPRTAVARAGGYLGLITVVGFLTAVLLSRLSG